MYLFQVSVLQRLEQLPFDESCDWNTPLSAWQYYRGTVGVGEQGTQSASQTATPMAPTEPSNPEADDKSSMPSDNSGGASSDPSSTIKQSSSSTATTKESPVQVTF